MLITITMSERQFDFIILGASGYTGQFVVEEVAKVSKDTGTIKYAIAGRNKKKLENVLTEAKRNTGLDFSDVCIIITDVNDKESLVSMAKKGKVVINCVGPGNAPINVTTLECALYGYASRKELSKIRRELFKGEKPPKPIYRSKPKGSLWWSSEAERWCLPNLASDRSVVMRTQNLNYRLFERKTNSV
ncbi:Saccharopine dehydrogenase-like oxidoreductase [Armadillidium vulgare]|nr:Saccharopine dehydrogenase-like oxidoreductase [Armadillidium vulgare]